MTHNLIKNLFKALTALFSVLLGGSAIAVELDKCIQPAEHSAITFLMVDRSDDFHNPQNFSQSLHSVQKILEPGERMVVALSTAATSDARLIFDMTRPKSSIWVSKLKIRAAEKLFTECLSTLEQSLLLTKEEHNKSALIETLSFVSKVVQADQAEKKRVIIYSDMIQNSDELSFYKAPTVVVEESIKKVEKLGLLWNFKNVEFQVAGAGVGVSEQKARSIEEFWRRYIEKSGGRVSFYGPVLLAAS